ncbi:MAG: DUF1697 domain-containing protein [Actinobacteria bacterium]|nr:DUF1697 domain-containing protein [Actinomycetota bacterium]
MARQIALLRGINVGGHKKVQMARLRELMERLGYRDVRTYVQSGNVVFTGPDRPTAEVADELEGQLAATFGFDVSVVVRSRDELADVVRANPLREVATEPSRHLVLFLAGPVDPERIAGLGADDFEPEAFHVRGREVFLWAPGGVRDSRVAKALCEQRLGVTATARNWRTVERLLALADEGPTE